MDNPIHQGEYWRSTLMNGRGLVRFILRSERVIVGEFIEATDLGVTLTFIESATRRGAYDETVPQDPLPNDVSDLDALPPHKDTTAFIPWASIELIVREPDEPLPPGDEGA